VIFLEVECAYFCVKFALKTVANNDQIKSNQIKSVYLLTAAKKKRKRNTTAKGMEGQK